MQVAVWISFSSAACICFTSMSINRKSAVLSRRQKYTALISPTHVLQLLMQLAIVMVSRLVLLETSAVEPIFVREHAASTITFHAQMPCWKAFPACFLLLAVHSLIFPAHSASLLLLPSIS